MSRSERTIRWRKSSYSSNQQGECLEVADGYADIPVRDSKNPTGPTLRFQATGWASFIGAVKAGSLAG
ncbi:DUF397 domain-containing protein [Streptomyces sp. MnatMP-M17]|uniref:DUF397 domain-containing protein n=1 Tax=unclassified Streptomyces TaxID=2593676 RepID=UPI00081EBD57|nr:DUF397 domain-containing protein [Streptomyces sp. MnatMP-M17]MYZ36201.1 DUF397 domain-containing protein [Streptomyces sp. SID4917]SCF81693.1 protein of unknown function [Streptomyces sp. MnatMP-M17]